MVPLDTIAFRHLQADHDGIRGKKDATYLMVYSPVGRSIKVKTDFIAGKTC